MKDLKPCDANDCFIRNNWFGASPKHPDNRKAYQRFVNCNINNVFNRLNIQRLIRSLKL